MKQIIISIKPEWVEQILNGEKTLELRKSAPKELPCEVYIYCTKPNAKEVLSLFVKKARGILGRAVEFIDRECVDNPGMRWSICNGKVVAKFVLNRVDERHILPTERMLPFNKSVEGDLKNLCLTKEQVIEYGNGEDYYAKIWHISNLEIFDEPKKLFDFCTYRKPSYVLERAPQSWCYVEELL